MKFEDEYDELEFLRMLVPRFWHAQNAGRVTADDSYDLDFCWDMIEEYTFFSEAREALAECGI